MQQLAKKEKRKKEKKNTLRRCWVDPPLLSSAQDSRSDSLLTSQRRMPRLADNLAV